MEEHFINGLFVLAGIVLKLIYDRATNRESKEEEREEETSKERVISDRMIAASMLEKVERQEVSIGTLRDNLAAKDAENAVLKLRIEFLQDENKKLRGEHINVE